MKNQEDVRSAIEAASAAASSAKAGATVMAGTASVAAAAKMELLRTAISDASLLVSLLIGLVMLGIQVIKIVRVYRSWDPNKARSKD